MRLSRAACIALATLCLVPATSSATKYAGEFMAWGGGARPLGMGGAFAAVGGDASSVYWNPAGIAGMDFHQVVLMHSERFGQLVNYNFGAYAQPTRLLSQDRKAAWGLALLHLGIDDIPVTKDIAFVDVDGDGKFDPNAGDFLPTDNVPLESDNSFALMGSFALSTSAGEVGGTLKIIYTNAIYGVTSTGIGIDLGYLRRDLFVEHLDVGAKLQDATGTYLSWSTGTNEFISPHLKLGTAYTIFSESLNGALLLAADADFFFENRRTASQFWAGSVSTDLHLGLELQFQEKVMVRGGIDGAEDGFTNPNYTAGAGLRISFLGFDYAYLHHDEFDATHRVSLQANFH